MTRLVSKDDDLDVLRGLRDIEVQELARDCISAGMPQAHATYFMQKLIELVSKYIAGPCTSKCMKIL